MCCVVFSTIGFFLSQGFRFAFFILVLWLRDECHILTVCGFIPCTYKCVTHTHTHTYLNRVVGGVDIELELQRSTQSTQHLLVVLFHVILWLKLVSDQ